MVVICYTQQLLSVAQQPLFDSYCIFLIIFLSQYFADVFYYLIQQLLSYRLHLMNIFSSAWCFQEILVGNTLVMLLASILDLRIYSIVSSFLLSNSLMQ